MAEQNRNELEVLAAEYVLGTLWGQARSDFEHRIAGDAAVRDVVIAWQERLRALSETDPEITPSPEVWHRIEAALGLGRSMAARPHSWCVRLWQSLLLWRWASLTTGAAAIALATVLYLTPPPASERYVAVLDDQSGRPTWLVSIDLQDNTLAIRPVTSVSPGSKSFELWALPGSGQPPRSMGLLNVAAQTVIRPPAGTPPLPADGYTLAISLEPEGGSPTGLPTGPVVFQGLLLKEDP